MDNKYRGNHCIFHSWTVSAIMGGIQLTFLLAIDFLLARMVHGAPPTIEQNSLVQIEIRANIDKAVDALLPSIHKFILNNGMDPMKLIDISEYIFPNLPGNLKGNVDFKKGWMQNLSLVKRTQHVTAIYKDKHLTLDMNLGFDVMNFNYEYYLKYLLYKREGYINGQLYKLDVNVKMTIDLNNHQLILDSIKFSDIGKYDIKFEGHLLDPIVNVLTKIITLVFRTRVLTIIENHAMLIFGAIIDEWNTKIPQPNRMQIINEWLDIRNTQL